MWTKQALQAGVTTEEISEIIQVARYMKMATVNDTVSSSYEILESVKS
jgi:alkylhydroperoxidase/carboxymuconolactone decarboxylase family protein YurZ